MDIRSKLIADIAAFLEKHRMLRTSLGRQALGNANIVAQLLKGRSITTTTYQNLVDWMEHYSRDVEAGLIEIPAERTKRRVGAPVRHPFRQLPSSEHLAPEPPASALTVEAHPPQ